jgi:hypothetical protein
LNSDLHRLNPIFFQHAESLSIQGIGTGGDADGIDQARGEKGLNLFQITNLILSTDCCKASTIKGTLFSSVLFFVRDPFKRIFDKVLYGGGRRESFRRCPLIAEETAFATPRIGKENRND